MILTHRTSLPSAKLLRDKIYEISKVKLLITTDPVKIKDKLHLRYGNSSPVNVTDTEYNNPRFISACSNKSIFSEVIENSGLALETPTFTRLKDRLPDFFPVIIRNTLTGSHGRGIEGVIETIDELAKYDINNYWAQYYKIVKEYRAHVIEGDIVKLFIKVPRDEDFKEEYPIRVNENYQFKLVDYDEGLNNGKYNLLKETVKKCQEGIKGKFYALDIGYCPGIERYVILEGNSGPGLNEQTARLYAEYLVEKII